MIIYTRENNEVSLALSYQNEWGNSSNAVEPQLFMWHMTCISADHSLWGTYQVAVEDSPIPIHFPTNTEGPLLSSGPFYKETGHGI